MKAYVKSMLAARGKMLVDRAMYENAMRDLQEVRKFAFEALDLMKIEGTSTSQLKQDLIALKMTGFKRDGFFVEFGATDGETLSNTALLEREYGWTGILAEPGRRWHDRLRANRSCRIDTRCVWKVSGEKVAFNETEIGEFSTIDGFSDSDLHTKRRRNGTVYEVETVSLSDLLTEHGAPNTIDYLSIDTEGSELAIIEAFDFGAWDIRFITCEHNHTANREKIHDHLRGFGYRRVLTFLSDFDDWYVRE